jgi:hypothetical protein
MTFAEELKEAAKKQREGRDAEAQAWMDKNWLRLAKCIHNHASLGEYILENYNPFENSAHELRPLILRKIVNHSGLKHKVVMEDGELLNVLTWEVE